MGYGAARSGDQRLDPAGGSGHHLRGRGPRLSYVTLIDFAGAPKAHTTTCQALLDFARRYNRNWILQRHGYRIPEQVRETALAQPAAAA